MHRAIVERILVVEDDPSTLGWLLAELAALPGVQASGCADVAEARQRAYAGVAELSWPGMTVRTDIAAAVAS